MEPSSITTTCAPTCEGPAVGIQSPGPRISKASTTTANHQQIIGPSSFITSLGPEAEIFEQPHKQKCPCSGQISSSTASPTRIRERRTFTGSERERVRKTGAYAIYKHSKTKVLVQRLGISNGSDHSSVYILYHYSVHILEPRNHPVIRSTADMGVGSPPSRKKSQRRMLLSNLHC